ncbi:MAG TPA: rod shape-determining protein MreC [Candidatus Ratteibacteria bacterium]|jgi:rod shape-determining protein MreC|nr:rod shape-determining protein MreC [bacterium]HPC29736.1 rod shape-determining protein MreC [bacterium]HRS05819.1 rod shape-determining protein MreC [Candidatus Ratteibacteria bacterium]HRV03801.1 rod shape-determining protein MreC [Candidatus Ratteibacteria bacterium]
MLWRFRREIIFFVFVITGIFFIKHNAVFKIFSSRNASIEKAIQPSVEDIILENENLRKMMGLKQKRGFSKIIYANAKSISPWVFPSQIVFDKGAKDGVKIGMSVISGNGSLIGRVVSAEEQSSSCITLYHPDNKVSVIIPRTGELAIVEGISLSVSYPYLRIRFLPPQCKASEGDTVETSGLTKLFSSSVKVGTIVKICPSKSEPVVQGFIKPFFTNENIKTAILVE